MVVKTYRTFQPSQQFRPLLFRRNLTTFRPQTRSPSLLSLSRFNSTKASTSTASTVTSFAQPSGNIDKEISEDIVEKGHQADKAQENDDQDNVQATTGVIEKKAREGLIYFSNIYPLAPFSGEFLSKALAYAFGLNKDRVVSILTRHSIPPDFPVSYTRIIPRYKDGGTFARFTISKNAPAELTPKDVESVISQTLKAHEYRPLFNPFRKLKVFTVLGIPWIEDLHRRVSNQVRVVFEGGDPLTQETIYSVLRRYGPIKDITIENDPKVPVKSAVVVYLYTRDASTARNCVNSLIVQNTQIHITYIPSEGGLNSIMKFISDHPRISIPIILALLAAFAVFVFNPIRIWFVEHKITNTSLPTFIENNPIVQWARGVTKETLSNIGKYLNRPHNTFSNSIQSLWIERQKSVRQIRQWLQENVNTFIVVSGPRGNGKKDLVTDFVLKDRENVLMIDCEQLVKNQNDPAFIRAAASQLGYYPVFPWMNNLSGYMDLIIQSLTGQKSGFAESSEQQFKSMLNTATVSIRKVALKNYHAAVKEEQDRSGSCETNNTIKITEEAYLQLHPESKPVIVISRYLNRTESNHQFVYKQLADFASVLVQANIAHVIFITSDVTYESALMSALPNRIFKVAEVSDADSKDAKRFVINQILEARRTEAQATSERLRRRHQSNKSAKQDDMYTDVDSEAKKKKEQEEVERMKEELKKEEETKQEQDAEKETLTSKILSYTTGAFQSDPESKHEDKEQSYQLEKNETTEHEITNDVSDSKEIASEFPYLDYALSPLGGRLTDLQSFARRLKSGEKPLDAAEDLVTQSAAEIYQMFLIRTQRVVLSSETSSSTPSSPANEWTQEQAWTLVKLLGNLSKYGFTKERQIALADSGLPAGSDRGTSNLNKYSNISHDAAECEPEVSMSFLFQDPNFKTKEQQKALTALQRAEMITLVHENGRTVAIKAGKPLYQAAFKALIDDKVLYSIQETMLLNSLITSTNKKIKDVEDELAIVGTLDRSYEVKQRSLYLEGKMMGLQNKVSDYEDKLSSMAKIMSGK